MQFGDGFGIESLKRGKDPAEPFGRLSDGTQEQMAILVRLSMGAMLSEQGHPTPIILDDALVFPMMIESFACSMRLAVPEGTNKSLC